jgi:hypothetical protein
MCELALLDMAILRPLVRDHGDQLVTCCRDCKRNGSALCIFYCCLDGNSFLAQNFKHSCWMHQKIYWRLVHVEDEPKIMLRSKEHWTNKLLELHHLLDCLGRGSCDTFVPNWCMIECFFRKRQTTSHCGMKVF